jgi:hypothetical protein
MAAAAINADLLEEGLAAVVEQHLPQNAPAQPNR